MNKIIKTAAFGLLLAAMTGCSQNEDPKLHSADSSTFTINTPALQDQVLVTVDDMTNPATFNLFASQPDYGMSLVCDYNALVSLDPECPADEESIKAGKTMVLKNQNSSSGAMAIKLFDLAVAANKLAGTTEEADYISKGTFAKPVPLYFRATCEVPNVEGTYVVSKNVVSYNAVDVVYAVLKPGWIYIAGDVQTIDGSVANDFTAPAEANQALYDNFKLMEPEELAGEKLYVGQFKTTPKENGGDTSNPDNASQFRFFTELRGWVTDCSLGSNEADFYCMPLNDNLANGQVFQGEIVNQGLGNWGIFNTDPSEFTVVVDVTGLNVYVKLGLHDVTFNGRTPIFQ